MIGERVVPAEEPGDEEDKESDIVSEDKTAFVWAEVKRVIKARDAEADTLAVLKRVSSLNDEEKALKKQIKSETLQLHQKTKEIIEALSDEEALRLLEYKWILPLMENLKKLPESVVSTLIAKTSALADKYAVTLTDIDAEIEETEAEFCAMLDELTGSEFDLIGLSELKKLFGR